MQRLYKATYLLLLFQFLISERLINSRWGSHISFFLEFIDIVTILYYIFIGSIILLYTLVASFARYEKYMICQISFSKFLDVLPGFTCVSSIGSLGIICLEVIILICIV